MKKQFLLIASLVLSLPRHLAADSDQHNQSAMGAYTVRDGCYRPDAVLFQPGRTDNLRMVFIFFEHTDDLQNKMLPVIMICWSKPQNIWRWCFSSRFPRFDATWKKKQNAVPLVSIHCVAVVRKWEGLPCLNHNDQFGTLLQQSGGWLTVALSAAPRTIWFDPIQKSPVQRWHYFKGTSVFFVSVGLTYDISKVFSVYLGDRYDPKNIRRLLTIPIQFPTYRRTYTICLRFILLAIMLWNSEATV